jgi:hypothetical protein
MKWQGIRPAVRDGMPKVLFVLAVAGVAFVYGTLVAKYKLFPYGIVRAGSIALITIYEQSTRDAADSRRFETFGHPVGTGDRWGTLSVDAGRENFLVAGGAWAFRDYCPDHGCLAVEFDRTGKMVRAYPFRPDQLNRKLIADLPYEQIVFDPAKHAYPFGMMQMTDGDLIVVFQYVGTFPDGGGVARIRPSGEVVWFRRDYTHHWPMPGREGEILLTSAAVLGQKITVTMPDGFKIPLECDGRILDGVILTVDGNGKEMERISVLNAVANSPYRGVLIETVRGCDPLHLNYVTRLGAAAEGTAGRYSPDDFLISMRHINGLMIVDARSHRVKDMIRGTFVFQHAAQPWKDGKILLYDNLGGDLGGGPSRLLAYDLVTRQEETIFPRGNLPKGTKVFSYSAADVSISASGDRALMAVPTAGLGYEVRLSDGAILAKFDNLHNIDDASGAKSARYYLTGFQYARRK